MSRAKDTYICEASSSSVHTYVFYIYFVYSTSFLILVLFDIIFHLPTKFSNMFQLIIYLKQ